MYAQNLHYCVICSVAEPELQGAAIFRTAPEPVPEPIFWSVGAESRSRLFKAAPTPFFGKVKKKSFVLVLEMNSAQFIVYTDKHALKQNNLNLFRA